MHRSKAKAIGMSTARRERLARKLAARKRALKLRRFVDAAEPVVVNPGYPPAVLQWPAEEGGPSSAGIGVTSRQPTRDCWIFP
jgi:hypothetical protein